jgi:hypothetical protein
MNPTIERILMTEWQYIASVLFLCVQAFGLGLVMGLAWCQIF